MRSITLAICGLTLGASVMIAQRQQATNPQVPPSTQTPKMSEEAIKPLVVMLDVKIAGSDDYGAGIIAGVNSNRLYIATANHVVRKDGKEADSLKVGFSWLPGETRPARLLATYDDQLDLAVIIVDNANELAIPPLPFDNIALASSLKKGDLVFPMGYPSRQPWSTRALPDAIASVQNGLRFDTNYLVPGNSGGALLTSAWRIAGLITERNGGQGAAIPIERVMEKLRGWNYQVQWRPGGDVSIAPDSLSGGGGARVGTIIGGIAGAGRGAAIGTPSATPIGPGRYEVRLLEVRSLNESIAQGNGPISRPGRDVGGRSNDARARVSLPPSPGFLDLQIVVNRIPLLHSQRLTVPYQPAAGEGVGEVNLQKGEEMVLNMRGLTTVVHDGRHAGAHAIQETLHEGNRIAVSVAFPDGDGDFIFYFAVVRK